ncbi:MAG: magnesium transporter [Dehalococcoidia bacterium]|jgi:magnesium transporter|nr:magnesium transporter [Dehalococcoidia bacterium]
MTTPPPDQQSPEEPESPTTTLQHLLQLHDLPAAIALAHELHGAELADALEHLHDDDRIEVLLALDSETIADALNYVEAHFRGELLARLPADQIAETLNLEDDDIATDVVQALPDETAGEVLNALPAERRDAIDALLVHHEHTAGGRMTGQLVTVAPEATVDQVLTQLRDSPLDVSQPFYLYVCEDERTLAGVLNLRTLISSPTTARADSLMIANPITVSVDSDQEDAARVLKQYKLLALPVVDENGHIVGSLTHDDLLDVLEDEATEDMFRMVGVSEDEDLRSVWRSVRHRLPWLTVNLVTVLAAAGVISLFEDTLARVAVLAAFLPVVGGMGGNAGIQTLTVVVRSLALGRLELRDTLTVAGHELAGGAIVGLFTGLLVGGVTIIWQGNPWLGAIVALALFANVVVGVVAGVLIPMGMYRLRQDPALSSGIWLTTATDLAGFLAFLSLATLLVSRID